MAKNNNSNKEDGGGKVMKFKDCNCDHSYQDKKYGPKKRAMNPAPGKKAFRCTVCGRLHD